MHTLKKFLWIFLFGFQLSAFCQTAVIPSTGYKIGSFVSAGWEIISHDSADFNDDGKKDHLVCIQDTLYKEEYTDDPVRTVLLIFAKENKYELRTIHSTYLACGACGGACGDPFSQPTVNDKVNSFTLRFRACGDGNAFANQVFQYQNGNWYLIGEHYGGCGPGEYCNDKKLKKEGCGIDVSIDYLKRIEITSGFDESCKYYSKKEKIENASLIKFTECSQYK